MEYIFAFFETPFFRKFVMSPLAVIGFYQIFRGVTAIIEKDLSEKAWLHDWMVVAYLVITVLGCICLMLVL